MQRSEQSWDATPCGLVKKKVGFSGKCPVSELYPEDTEGRYFLNVHKFLSDFTASKLGRQIIFVVIIVKNFNFQRLFCGWCKSRQKSNVKSILLGFNPFANTRWFKYDRNKL